jgi:NADH dehydrogenase [ubiquinone] 1 alpha subcomplex assembly factor 7
MNESLCDILARRIRVTGPLTVAEFMAEAAGHPQHGYYRRADPFGRAGDFVTAPEVSQMFGELLGLWCVSVWQQMGEPACTLVELGPGRGTMMADVWRAARVSPRFQAAARVHLVETSPLLRGLQAETLAAVDLRPSWHDDLTQIPDGPLLLLANEFFDALPVHQFQRAVAGWQERAIDIDAQDGLRFVLTAPGPTLALIEADERDAAPIGTMAEVSPASLGVMDSIARRIVAQGGGALIVDYGQAGALGDSLQAVRRHGTHPFLADPGEADVSARVDFAALARVAREAGATVGGPIGQGDFLDALGIRLRAARLAERAAPGQADDIAAALKRLCDEGQMGSLFKVLAATGPAQPAPPGFTIAAERQC